MRLRSLLTLVFKAHEIPWLKVLAALCLGLSAVMAYDIAIAARLDSWPVAQGIRSHQSEQLREVAESVSRGGKQARTVRMTSLATYRAKYRYVAKDHSYELVTNWRKKSWPQQTKIYHHPNSPSRAFVIKPEINAAHWLVMVASAGAAAWLLRFAGMDPAE